MTDQLTFRPATTADLALVAGLIRGLAEHEGRSRECTFHDSQLQEHLFGVDPKAQVVLAELDGQPVGFMLYFLTFGTFTGCPGLYLEDLFLLPAYRGRGFGRQMFDVLRHIAWSEGCNRIDWSVLDTNHAAIGFYRALGALPEGEREWQRYTLPLV